MKVFILDMFLRISISELPEGSLCQEMLERGRLFVACPGSLRFHLHP